MYWSLISSSVILFFGKTELIPRTSFFENTLEYHLLYIKFGQSNYVNTLNVDLATIAYLSIFRLRSYS